MNQKEFNEIIEEHKKWLICTEDMKILPDTINTFKGTISKARFTSEIFENINFSRVDLSFARFSSCEFINCKFDNTIFYNAEFFNCNFSAQDLSKASFYQAKIKECHGYDKKEMKNSTKTYPKYWEEEIEKEYDDQER